MLGHIDMLSAHDVTLLGCGMVKTPFLTRFSVECCHSKAIFTPLLSLRRKFLAETGSKPEVPGELVYNEMFDERGEEEELLVPGDVCLMTRTMSSLRGSR